MKALFTVLLTLTLLISLTACGEKAPDTDTSTATTATAETSSLSTTTTTLPSSAATTTTGKTLTPVETREIALRDADVSFDDAYDLWVEFDRDDGVPYYEVDFKANGTEYDYAIHAEDGRVLKAEREPLRNTDTTTHTTSDTIYNRSDPTLTYREAVAIAFAHAGVKEADTYDLSVEYEYERNTPVYEIDFDAGGQEYEYIVHADSGEILYSEKHPAD